MAPVQRAFEPTIWYRIDRDGIVTVNIIRAEMGQHIGTALARILADELEVDWDNVRLDAVDSDPKWGLMVTGGSWSVWMTFPVFSRAGAAGRIALVEEGAKLLGVLRRPMHCAQRRRRCRRIGRSPMARSSGAAISAAPSPPTNWRGCRSSPPRSGG